MSRLPPIAPSDQNRNQAKAHEKIDVATSAYFSSSTTLKNNDGAFIGPFVHLIYTPTMTQPYLNFITTLTSIPSLKKRPITPLTLELIILATASQYQAAYCLDTHYDIAQKTGLTADQAKDAYDGRTPKGLRPLDTAVYEFARSLARTRGPVATEVWDRLKRVLKECGNDEGDVDVDGIMAGMVQVVAWYAYNSTLMNAVDLKSPRLSRLSRL